MANNGWEQYFNGHAPRYMSNPFTYGTLKEVDFLIEEFKLPEGSRILDVGCGTGRHSIELAKRGYNMTGLDISKGMLSEAKTAAEEEGVKIDFIQSDATMFISKPDYDAAICLCEGAFCLLGKGDDHHERDFSILRNINAALKPGSKLILTALNACVPIRQYTYDDVAKGIFDPITMVETHEMESEAPDDDNRITIRERSYTPPELTLLFKLAGFEVQHIWGGTAGNWGRRPLDLDEMEIMVVAVKPE